MSETLTGAVAQLFLTYLNRAPEFTAMQFYTARLATLLDEEGAHPAAQSHALKSLSATIFRDGQAYGEVPDADLTDADFVAWVYGRLLGREPDVVGKAYWLAQLESGSLVREELAFVMAQAAADDPRDAAFIANRIEVAERFALPENSGPAVIGKMPFNAGEVMAGVTEDPATVEVAIDRLYSNYEPPAPPPPPPPPPPEPPVARIYDLTPDADDLRGGAGNDVFRAPAQSDAGNLVATLQGFDRLHGGAGTDRLLADLAGTDAGTPAITSIERFELTNTAQGRATLSFAAISDARQVVPTGDQGAIDLADIDGKALRSLDARGFDGDASIWAIADGTGADLGNTVFFMGEGAHELRLAGAFAAGVTIWASAASTLALDAAAYASYAALRAEDLARIDGVGRLALTDAMQAGDLLVTPASVTSIELRSGVAAGAQAGVVVGAGDAEITWDGNFATHSGTLMVAGGPGVEDATVSLAHNGVDANGVDAPVQASLDIQLSTARIVADGLPTQGYALSLAGALEAIQFAGERRVTMDVDTLAGSATTSLATIDASDNTGGVTLDLSRAQNVATTGSQGDDVFVIETTDAIVGRSSVLAGGLGNDTLRGDVVALAQLAVGLSSIERVELDLTGAGSQSMSFFSAPGVTDIVLTADMGVQTLNNLDASSLETIDMGDGAYQLRINGAVGAGVSITGGAANTLVLDRDAYVSLMSGGAENPAVLSGMGGLVLLDAMAAGDVLAAPASATQIELRAGTAAGAQATVIAGADDSQVTIAGNLATNSGTLTLSGAPGVDTVTVNLAHNALDANGVDEAVGVSLDIQVSQARIVAEGLPEDGYVLSLQGQTQTLEFAGDRRVSAAFDNAAGGVLRGLISVDASDHTGGVTFDLSRADAVKVTGSQADDVFTAQTVAGLSLAGRGALDGGMGVNRLQGDVAAIGIIEAGLQNIQDVQLDLGVSNGGTVSFADAVGVQSITLTSRQGEHVIREVDGASLTYFGANELRLGTHNRVDLHIDNASALGDAVIEISGNQSRVYLNGEVGDGVTIRKTDVSGSLFLALDTQAYLSLREGDAARNITGAQGIVITDGMAGTNTFDQAIGGGNVIALEGGIATGAAVTIDLDVFPNVVLTGDLTTNELGTLRLVRDASPSIPGFLTLQGTTAGVAELDIEVGTASLSLQSVSRAPNTYDITLSQVDGAMTLDTLFVSLRNDAQIELDNTTGNGLDASFDRVVLDNSTGATSLRLDLTDATGITVDGRSNYRDDFIIDADAITNTGSEILGAQVNLITDVSTGDVALFERANEVVWTSVRTNAIDVSTADTFEEALYIGVTSVVEPNWLAFGWFYYEDNTYLFSAPDANTVGVIGVQGIRNFDAFNSFDRVPGYIEVELA